MRSLALLLFSLVACGDDSPQGNDGGGGSAQTAGGAAPVGGAPAAGGGGGASSTPCDAYCACMSETCSSFAAYPFADEAACLAKCETFTADELSCFGAFCETASTGTATEHQCEHAWADQGTSEC